MVGGLVWVTAWTAWPLHGISFFFVGVYVYESMCTCVSSRGQEECTTA